MISKRITKQLLSVSAVAFLLAACSNSSSVPGEESNPLATQVEGMWWSLIDSAGSLAMGKDSLENARIVQAFQLNKDGSGYAVTLFFDDESNELTYIVDLYCRR